MNGKIDFFKNSSTNPTLSDEIKFEIKNFIFRVTNPKSRKIQPKHNYLNLGCGENPKIGFDNADAPRFRNKNREIFPINLKKRLPFTDLSYEGIFIEHTLEHFSPHDAFNLLNEIYRVLKINGKVRIVVPDLDLYLSHIKVSNPEFAHYQSTAEVIYRLTQDWGHKSLYNFEIFDLLLREIGFKNVGRYEFMKGTECLLIDQILRKWESLYIEAEKI
jgi:predicted SAM-dependent methyltransferase